MIINIGSENPVKVEAVKELIKSYGFLRDAKVFPVKVDSEVYKQPMSLEETVRGAVNRARNAFKDCDYSFGLESGLMKVPYTRTGYLDFCACAVYDGKNFSIGNSCAFEFPIKVIELLEREKLDINEAFFKVGLTDNEKIGSFEGAISLLTRGKVDRKAYTKQAIQMALIQLENPDLY